MIAICVNFKVNDENIAPFIEMARELMEKTNKEDGCFSYELIRNKKDPNAFAIMERWENQESLNVHGQSEHFKRIVPKLGDLMEGKAEMNAYDVII